MFSGGIYKGGNVKQLERFLACITKTSHPKVRLTRRVEMPDSCPEMSLFRCSTDDIDAREASFKQINNNQ